MNKKYFPYTGFGSFTRDCQLSQAFSGGKSVEVIVGKDTVKSMIDEDVFRYDGINDKDQMITTLFPILSGKFNIGNFEEGYWIIFE